MERIKNEGNTLWKPIRFCDRNGVYRVSEFGEVQSRYYGNEWRSLKGAVMNGGSKGDVRGIDFIIDGKRHKVSFYRILAATFPVWDFTSKKTKKKKFSYNELLRCNLYCYIIDKKKPLHVDNIGVYTHSQNIHKSGAQEIAPTGRRKFNEKEVKRIRKDYKKLGSVELARIYDVTPNTIRRAAIGEHYSHIV